MTTPKKTVGTRKTITMAHPLGKYATPDDIQQWQLATISSKLDTIIEELQERREPAKRREVGS